jgi:hypothetical protein
MVLGQYLVTTVTNKYLIQEEIKGELNSANAFFHSVQNLSFYLLLPKIVKIRIHKTVILPVQL